MQIDRLDHFVLTVQSKVQVDVLSGGYRDRFIEPSDVLECSSPDQSISGNHVFWACDYLPLRHDSSTSTSQIACIYNKLSFMLFFVSFARFSSTIVDEKQGRQKKVRKDIRKIRSKKTCIAYIVMV